MEVFDAGFKSARGDSGVALNGALAAAEGWISIVGVNLLVLPGEEWADRIAASRNDVLSELADLRFEATTRMSEPVQACERHAQLHREVRELRDTARENDSMSDDEVEPVAIQLQRMIWLNQDSIWKGNLPWPMRHKHWTPRKPSNALILICITKLHCVTCLKGQR